RKTPPDEARRRYDALISEWLAAGRRVTDAATAATGSTRFGPGLAVAELILAFWRHAQRHYRRPGGTGTNELNDQRLSLRPLRELYAALPAADFSPLKLKAVRQRMVEAGLSRGVINQRVGRIVRMYKWAVGDELVPVAVYQALKAVPGLQ